MRLHPALLRHAPPANTRYPTIGTTRVKPMVLVITAQPMSTPATAARPPVGSPFPSNAHNAPTRRAWNHSSDMMSASICSW